MPFKDISYLELWRLLCSAKKNNSVIFFYFGPVVQEEMLFKGIFLSGALASRNHLCNIGRGYYEKQFCEVILNLGQWFGRCR